MNSFFILLMRVNQKPTWFYVLLLTESFLDDLARQTHQLLLPLPPLLHLRAQQSGDRIRVEDLLRRLDESVNLAERRPKF